MKINNLRILLTCALALFFQILFAAEVSEGSTVWSCIAKGATRCSTCSTATHLQITSSLR